MKAHLKISAHQGKLVIDLPDELVASLGLQEGDQLDVEVVRTQSKLVPQRPDLAALRKFRGRLPTGFKFDRHDANSR